jgi:hypothetical protein
MAIEPTWSLSTVLGWTTSSLLLVVACLRFGFAAISIAPAYRHQFCCLGMSN